MSDLVAVGALSHSPLLNGATAGKTLPAGVGAFGDAARALGRRLLDARPDVLLVIGPDHFRSLFYANMPAFLLGTGTVRGYGDWGTRAGELPSLPAFARALHRGLLARDFDVSCSYDAEIDHGLTQPLDLCAIPASLPVVPLIVNANAPPRPSVRRCFALGAALRDAIAAHPMPLRVAALASGGLSHTPPGADIDRATGPARERLIHGAATVRADEAGRVAGILASVATLARGINEAWDRRLLARLGAGDGASVAAELDDEAIDAEGGNGGHEVRTWFVAAGLAGGAPLETLAYAPVPELITGMGVGAFATR
jgi:2,3-dihydroxyphenylpropionate 1,2-dioxygenase